ncbi:MAG TPA: DUF3349 domain-containing protein [Acidothermaceae bacterium]
MALSTLLESIVAWVRKGYPDGIPRQDYIPLLALLKRRMTDDELVAVAREIAGSGDEDPVSISVAIEALTHEEPSAADIERVRDHIAQSGWDPVSDVVPTP